MKGFYTGKLGGQAHRVAQRFAAVYAALTLARPQLGIDPEPVRQCFHAWKELEGTGNRENSIIIERAADFMQQNGTSPRFAPWGATQTFPDHAGYRNGDEYWIIPPVFKAEICGTVSNAEVRRSVRNTARPRLAAKTERRALYNRLSGQDSTRLRTAWHHPTARLGRRLTRRPRPARGFLCPQPPPETLPQD